MKNYKLSIPSPCHEDWNKMTPNEKGRFCNQCDKTVVDFAKLEDEEVIEYFLELQKQTNHSICGHIKKKQLAPTRTFQPLRIAVVGLLLFSTSYLLQSCSTETEKVQTEESFDDGYKESILGETLPYDGYHEEIIYIENSLVQGQIIEEETTTVLKSSTTKPSKKEREIIELKPGCIEHTYPETMLGKFILHVQPDDDNSEKPIEAQKED